MLIQLELLGELPHKFYFLACLHMQHSGLQLLQHKQQHCNTCVNGKIDAHKLMPHFSIEFEVVVLEYFLWAQLWAAM